MESFAATIRVGEYVTIENILRVGEELSKIYLSIIFCSYSVRVCSIIIGRERKGGTYLYCGWKGNSRQLLNNNEKKLSLKEKFTRKTIINALIRVKRSDGRILNSQGTTHDFIDNYNDVLLYKMNSGDFTNPLLSSRAH